MIDHAGLRDEIQGDALGLGYAAWVAAGADTLVAALLNATTGPGAASVTVPALTSDQVRKMVLPGLLVFSTASAGVQARWQPFLNLLAGVQEVTNDAEFQGLMALYCSDFGPLTGSGGIPAMDAARLSRYCTRAGSRAEVLFGYGVSVSDTDVALALRGA